MVLELRQGLLGATRTSLLARTSQRLDNLAESPLLSCNLAAWHKANVQIDSTARLQHRGPRRTSAVAFTMRKQQAPVFFNGTSSGTWRSSKKEPNSKLPRGSSHCSTFAHAILLKSRHCTCLKSRRLPTAPSAQCYACHMQCVELSGLGLLRSIMRHLC